MKSIYFSKIHNYKFFVTIPTPEGCLWNLTIFYFELTIAGSKVYLGKSTSTLKLVKQVINPRDGLVILYDDLGKIMIFN